MASNPREREREEREMLVLSDLNIESNGLRGTERCVYVYVLVFVEYDSSLVSDTTSCRSRAI